MATKRRLELEGMLVPYLINAALVQSASRHARKEYTPRCHRLGYHYRYSSNQPLSSKQSSLSDATSETVWEDIRYKLLNDYYFHFVDQKGYRRERLYFGQIQEYKLPPTIP